MAETGQGEAADRFVEAATRFLSKKIADHLIGKQLAPPALAEACGGAESTWRSKMNRHRIFQLEDLVKIAASVDPTVFDAMHVHVGDGRDLLPRNLHSGVTLVPQRLPRLAANGGVWEELSQALDAWLTAEREAGRDTLITPDVVRHNIVVAMSERGSPSDQAQSDTHDGLGLLRWPQQARAVAVWCVPGTEPAGSMDVRDLTEQLSKAVNSTRHVLLVAMGGEAISTLEELAVNALDWFPLTTAEAARSQPGGGREPPRLRPLLRGAECWTAEVR